jgi:protein phosphatase
MYADHFTLDVEKGDRIILCSDGLSSMIADEAIEDVALSCPTPQNCADALVQAALDAGGFDNVTVVVVDVARDAVAERHARQMMRGAFGVLLGMVALLIAAFIGFSLFVGKSWFVGSENGEVAIYKGIHGDFFGMNLYELTERTGVVVSDLPDATQKSLEEGIATASEDDARATVESYRSQIGLERQKAADTEEAASSATHDDGANAAPTTASPTSPATTTSAAPASGSSEGAGADATSVGADAPAAEEGGE